MGLKQILQALLLLAVAALTSACSTGPAAPTESYDGLVLVPDTRLGVVYKRPGADLTGYDSYGLMACEVAFRKNWQRDQNSSRIDLGSRVTQKDVDRIKDKLGEECGKYFREALEQGHRVCALRLRGLAGDAGYQGGFVEHYLLDWLYPAALDRSIQVGLGLAVIVVNLVAYGWVAARRRTQATRR